MMGRGFTLVETVLVLALAGLLLYGGAVSLEREVPRFRLQTGVWGILALLNQARFQAIWKGAPVRVRFVPDGARLEWHDGEADRWRLTRSVVFEGVSVISNNDPAFYPEGTVTNLATISVSNSRGAYKITVAISGRVKAVKIR